MHITNNQVIAADNRAKNMIAMAKARASMMLKPEAPMLTPEQQLIKYAEIKNNPALVEQIKREHGEQGWRDFENAMLALAQAKE